MSRIPPELKVVIPEDRVAQYPAERRDASRLLVYDRAAGRVIHVGFFPDALDSIAGDLVVLNETRVLPAVVPGVKQPGGGHVEALFLVSPSEGAVDWAAFTNPAPPDGLKVAALVNPGRRLKPGQVITFADDSRYELTAKAPDGRWSGVWQSAQPGVSFLDWLNQLGKPPLPPYIRREADVGDSERYQTVYAARAGSLAAPTAGLHFTPELLAELPRRGCDIARLTLDVGLGTFLPIRDEDVSQHQMHVETYHISDTAVAAVNAAKASGRRVTAVGTTVVRALEDAGQRGEILTAGDYAAGIFIRPPYRFQVVDRLLTNFHRPDSTLIQLMAALIGWDGVNESYSAALDAGFRFFSYGDAMLVV